MTDYALLLSADEAVWEAASPEARAAEFARHDAFTQALAARGHAIVGGAQLAPSRGATVVRRTEAGVIVSDGPYAETVEQLGGFYLVRTDDLADLIDACTILAGADGVEIRECLPDPDEAQDEGGGR